MLFRSHLLILSFLKSIWLRKLKINKCHYSYWCHRKSYFNVLKETKVRLILEKDIHHKDTIIIDLTTLRACQLVFWDGHTHDFTLFKESIGQVCQSNYLFLLFRYYEYSWDIFFPLKSSKKHVSTVEDKKFNRDSCNTY